MTDDRGFEEAALMKRWIPMILCLVLAACAPAAPSSPEAESGAASPVESASVSQSEESAPGSSEENSVPATDAPAMPSSSADEAPSGSGRGYGPEGSGQEVGPKYLFVTDPDQETYSTPLVFGTDEEESDMTVTWTTPQVISASMGPLTRCPPDVREKVLESAEAVAGWSEAQMEFLENTPVYLVRSEQGRLAGGDTVFSLYKLGPGLSPFALMAETGGTAVCYPLNPAGLVMDFWAVDADGDGVSEILLSSLPEGRSGTWQAVLCRLEGEKLEKLYSFQEFDTGFTVSVDDAAGQYTVENKATGYERTFPFRPFSDYWLDRADGDNTRVTDIREDLFLEPENPLPAGVASFTRLVPADVDGDGADEFLTAELMGAGDIDWGRKYAVLKYDAAENAMLVKEAAYMPRPEGVFLKKWMERTDELFYTGDVKE